MNKIRDLGIKKNDIVRVKFKDLNSIVKQSGLPFQDLDELLRLSSNMRAYYNGGDFLVSEDFDRDNFDSTIGDAIEVKNHFDNDYSFLIYEFAIESIEIVNDARRFISSDFDIVVVRVDDELFINGKPVIGDEREKRKEHNRYKKKEDDQYVNQGRKLLKIFEEFITDLAVSDSINDKGLK
jgi:hypothetical protein